MVIRDTLPVTESMSLFLLSSSAKHNQILRVPGESWLWILVGIVGIAAVLAEENPFQAGTAPACQLLPSAPAIPGVPGSGTAALGLCTQEKRAGTAQGWDSTTKF